MANPQTTQQQDQPPDSISLKKFAGLVNTVGRDRLGPDELETALNVDLDDRGQLRRRRGFQRASVGTFGSLFTSDEGTVYGIKNGVLGVINPDMSFLSLQSGYTNASVCYIQVGSNIYFSSGNAGLAGIIDQLTLTVSPWQGNPPSEFLSPVVNPTSYLPAIRGRLIGPPPFATALAYFNGRIYLAEGNTVWATELFLYNYVEKVTNFLPFEAPVTMIGAVGDGLYVGTQEGLWFLSGNFKEMKRQRVMDTAVIPGSMVEIPGEVGNPPQVGLEQDTPTQVSIMFMTEAGYCTGRDSGEVFNETENRFVFPAATSASAVYRFQDGVHSYVTVLNSTGTPSANTRIGDWVDAELVKAGTWITGEDCLVTTDSLSYDWIPA
jgi:hypothetical protein